MKQPVDMPTELLISTLNANSSISILASTYAGNYDSRKNGKRFKAELDRIVKAQQSRNDEIIKRHSPELMKPTIEERALAWALSGDTGISSETMCAYFTGVKKGGPFGSQAPSDAADRGRCIRLLKLIPEWIERLDELKALDVGTISINGADPIPRSQDSHSWTHQVPLIIKEGDFNDEQTSKL